MKDAFTIKCCKALSTGLLMLAATWSLILSGCGMNGTVAETNMESETAMLESITESISEESWLGAGYPKFTDLNCDYCGYIQTITKEQVTFIPAEFIGGQDVERIKELGLTEYDMVSGYSIQNLGEPISYKIAEDCEYIFIDWEHEYTDYKIIGENTVPSVKEEYKDRVEYADEKEGKVKTKDMELFTRGISDFSNSNQPYFFVIEDDKIVRIFELWMA